jgi:hypothetical protein
VHRVCCVCGIEYGVKSPDDDRVTHGFCLLCLQKELKRTRKEIAVLKTALTDVEEKNTYSLAAI